jgi:transglutaminase-like putative cysteine protease
MLQSLRAWALVTALLVTPHAGAAEVWEVPAFSASARELQQAAAAIKRERPADVVVLLDERRYVFDEQHRVTMTSRMIYRVDSPDGVENWAASSASWQPWYQAPPVIRARVITTDGREHLLDQRLLRDAARRSDNQVYDDSHVTEGPLPAIEVGAVIEEEVTLRDEKPFFPAGTVYREYIGRPVPVLHTRVIIDAPESLPLKRTTHLLPDAQAKETRANGRVRWVLEHGVIDAREAMDSNLPPDQPSWASVDFSTGASWEAIATNYRELTEPRIRKDDARPLLAGLKAPLPRSASREFIASLVERLHREVRYTGVEFGEARLIPEYPAETLRRKFGDCKDKSTLLVAALRASGIDAYLALLSAGDGQDVMPDLPGLGMFDHAIVYIPASSAGERDLWIDATTEYARVGTLPAADANRLALVIRAGEKSLVRTPALESADNAQIETREFHLSEYGPARVVETTETRGTIELEYRGWYAGADTKERLDSLLEYAQSTYRAKALTKYTHTASTDFSKFYSMTLDMRDAPVGSTDLNSAAVGVSLGNIATRLPSYFSEQLDEEQASAEPRKHDVVFEPYVVEWRYRVHAPDGFRARGLPANSTLQLGPARLTAEFSHADGVVSANWRFDTVKGRYTPAESAAFLAGLRELKRREVLLLAFDHQGAALRSEGDFKGSLATFRSLADKHPKQAVHRLRHAYALLEAGLGTRAQLEAKAATRLEPKYAFAWKVQGWMLQHDAVGRRFGAGYDRDGAIAAYRKARALDPQDLDIAADLGVLLEHDERGERYADKASLELAVAEYKARATLMREGQKADRYTDNLYYSLLYLRRFGEARDGLKKEDLTSTRRALTLAAIAGADGAARAIEAARDIAGSESDRRTALKSAGGILTNLREYSAAADLLEASMRGQSVTAADTQRITMLRKTTAAERDQVQVSDPRSVVLKAYSLLLSAGNRLAEFRELGSALAQESVDIGADYDNARRLMYSALARQDTPFDVAADLVYGNLRVTVEGDDARGYRAQVRGSGMTINYYVVREAGTYKLLAVSPLTGPMARAALERLDADDIEGARRWLDWARLEQRVANSEDPLVGYTFARFWTVGGRADAADMRTAAALLLADSQSPARALPLLLAAQATARSDAEKLNLDLALARSYQELERWPELEQVGARLAAAWPNSGLAFHFQQWARIRQKRFDEVAAAARERLARLPDDMTATRVLVESADARGAFAEMSQLMEPVINSSRATSAEFNEYAWIALLRRPVSERAVEVARQAFDETQGRENAVAHTLACVYAATGKPGEARDLLLKGLSRVVTADQLDDSSWFGFALIAEAYGDVESARDYYSRVARPKKGHVPATSLFSMAQQRLAAL